MAQLLTDDPAKAFDYYSKHYGWEKDHAHDMGAMGIYQTFRTDKPLYTGGMLARKGPGMPEGIPPHWQFYFTVDDIEAAQKRVIDAGGEIVFLLWMSLEGRAFYRPQTIRAATLLSCRDQNRNRDGLYVRWSRSSFTGEQRRNYLGV